jgi:hypothetical protein
MNKKTARGDEQLFFDMSFELNENPYLDSNQKPKTL